MPLRSNRPQAAGVIHRSEREQKPKDQMQSRARQSLRENGDSDSKHANMLGRVAWQERHAVPLRFRNRVITQTRRGAGPRAAQVLFCDAGSQEGDRARAPAFPCNSQYQYFVFFAHSLLG